MSFINIHIKLPYLQHLWYGTNAVIKMHAWWYLFSCDGSIWLLVTSSSHWALAKHFYEQRKQLLRRTLQMCMLVWPSMSYQRNLVYISRHVKKFVFLSHVHALTKNNTCMFRIQLFRNFSILEILNLGSTWSSRNFPAI